MNPTAGNAFERSWSASRGRPRSLVSMLTPMQAKLEPMNDAFELTLAPMRAVDAMPVWHTFAQNDQPSTLLAELPSHAESAGQIDPLMVARLLERLAIDAGEILDPSHVLLTDAQLRNVLHLVNCDRLLLVKLTGMVDARDAAAIDAMVRGGESALDADLRAVASMQVTRDSIITLHARSAEHAHALVAENFRQYLAALLDRPVGTIDPPQPWQIERLMSETGELTVRPIESEVFSTFVDIGISTSPNSTTGPAARSLIFDLPSGTWHDEE